MRGTIGSYLWLAVDEIYARAEAVATGQPMLEKPARRATEFPLIRRFFAQKDARGLVNEFYALKEMAEEAANTAEQLEAIGDPDRGEVAIETQRYKDILPILNEKNKQLIELRNERIQIQQRRDLDGEQKRAFIDAITMQELAVVGDVIELKKFTRGK